MNKQFIFLALMLLSAVLTAQDNPQWLRHSRISPDGQTIVFTYKGDLYTVPASGGEAKQITFHQAHDFQAVWSNDSKKIAFASDRYGNFDVYVMNATGGTAERLTYHSAAEIPYSFTNDDQSIHFGAARQDDVSHRQFPTGSQPELYTVPAAGGAISQVATIPMEFTDVSPDGKTILYHDKKGGENEWRKHQRSAIARDIWKYDIETKKHTKLTEFEGEDRRPVFAADGDTFYYLSERSGTFNVHKMKISDPGNSSQVTNFELHPVRFLSIGNGTLSFGFDGELYTMKPGGSPEKIDVKIVTQDTDNSDQFVSISGGVEEMAISPNGKEIAFISRGEVFVTSVDESFTKRITDTPQRERFLTWGPEGKSIVYSSEREGKWGIYQAKKDRKEEPFFYASTLISESPLLVNEKDNYLPQFSPDGKKMAWVEDRRVFKVKDLSSGSEITLLPSEELFHMRDGDKDFTWSPDSKWLLMSWGVSLNNSDILLLAADGSERINLNRSGYYDISPKWVNDGKQMIWFSNRNGLKSYATSGQTEYDVYSMFFTREAWEEYNLSDEDYKLKKAIEEADKKPEEKSDEDDKKGKKKKKEDDKNEKKIEDLKFDREDMRDRVARMTIHSSRLGDAVLSKKGDKLYYLSSFEDRMNLWETDLRTKETKMLLKLNSGGGSLQWDKKRENLYLLTGGKISKIDPAKKSKKPVKINGEMKLDKLAQRQAIFDHVWIRTKAVFYHPDFHGVDWDLMKKEYQKYVPHIGNTYENVEMLSEMLGELNVSHAGARYRGGSFDNPDQTASLGIFMDYDYSGDGIRIAEVIKNGPLDRTDLKVKNGAVIKKIDGEKIEADKDVAAYLNRKAGKFTLLEIMDPGSEKTRMITVKPVSLSAERSLLYDRWTKKNEKEVEKKSEGKLGYVHIPGMGDGPYRKIYQDMMGKYFDREAVIVDTRFNGGGDLVADLAMFFTGEPFITYATEARVVGGEPTSRWTKPTLAMINEAQYSDGHCFAAGYTDLKIGKTVGMPTPGTCSFAGWELLPDGSVWGVVPVSAKDKQGEWMENNQTEPDYQVKNMPGAVDENRDEQLEKAIEVLLEEVK